MMPAVGHLKVDMKRINGLDGIRGVAIILILIWHYLTCQIHIHHNILLFIKKITLLSWSGLDLFFVLSGFLITRILIINQNSENLFRTFYLRRICRIFPLYYFLLGTFIILRYLVPKSLIWLFNEPLPLWAYITFTQNYIMGINNTYGPHWLSSTWSLAIEEQFYLFLPLIIKFYDNKKLPFLFILLILISPILRLHYSSFGSYVYTLCRADSLMSGALLAFILTNKHYMIFCKRNINNFMLIFIALFLGIMVLADRYNSVGGVFNHLWLSWFYAIFILIVVSDENFWFSKIFNNRILVWFGLRSYAIYLLHQIYSGILHGYFNSSVPQIFNGKSALLTISSFFITLFTAEISYHFFEKPIMNWGHRLKYTQEMPSPVQLSGIPNSCRTHAG